MPGRHGNTSDYRYGFQGQEMDNEIKGEGNSINYTFRMHDPRIGRFGSIDPLSIGYPYYSPYSFSGNKVIAFGEIEGLEEGWVIHGEKIVKIEGPRIEILNSFQTQEMAEIGLSLGMTTPKLLDSYMVLLEKQLNNPSPAYTKPASTISVQLTTVEKYPQHFPGATVGPQMAIGAEEILTDALGIGIANKFYKGYKIWKKSQLVRKTVSLAENLTHPEFINNADEAFNIWKTAQKKAVANVNRSGKTVLGSYPEYIQMAKKNGNSYFDIGATWGELARRGQNTWEINKIFLDKVASQGDDIIIVLGKDKKPGKYLKKEIEYLTEQKGYMWKDAEKTILTKSKG